MGTELPSRSGIEKLPLDGGVEFNRLIFETSPYLLQHARNPVDWYPWGEAAFDKARAENKPVFLSVGYSSCHWCHVMAHESFEKESIAALLNQYFVCVKVDREERPDLDDIYMKATQLMTRRGGWPNSVFLTPTGRPWYAGTYFPPADRNGMPGFTTVLNRLKEFWSKNRDQAEEQADEFELAIREMSLPRADPAEWSDQLAKTVRAQLEQDGDEEFGGFGLQPKFPPHARLEYLLDQFANTQDASILCMVTGTLDAMALGGIHDQIGGGFHRYATDRRWLLPHFEKMLYDNAQLLRIYARAWTLTGSERYRVVALAIFDWLQREMLAPEGGFYSALDADSDGEEGKFYVWSQDELAAVLGVDAVRFAEQYRCEAVGNFYDEATGKRTGLNIPHLAAFVSPADAKFMKTMRVKLLNARASRVRPGLDDKVLAGWNGLAIGALAYAGAVLDYPAMLDAAKRCAEFIRHTMWASGQLCRSYNRGSARQSAFLDDYACVADGVLDLYDATGENEWLAFAHELVDVVQSKFAASSGGYYFTSQDHEKLLTRTQDVFDNVTPSGNGVAARVLVRLGERKPAERLFQRFSGDIHRAPTSALNAIRAWQQLQAGPVQVTVSPLWLRAGVNNVDVKLRIIHGWHINSHQPLQDYLKPTAVRLNGAEGSAIYPDGIVKAFGGRGEKMSVYEELVSLCVPVELAEGMATVELTVEYQPCSDTVCDAPVKRVFKLRAG